MTGLEHYREAERLIEQADEWLDADLGWKASLISEERIARRGSDLSAAQVHATLALAAVTAETGGLIKEEAFGPTAWARAAGGAS